MDQATVLIVTYLLGVLRRATLDPDSSSLDQETVKLLRDEATRALASLNPNAPAPPGYARAVTADYKPTSKSGGE